MKITPKVICRAIECSFGKFDPFRRARLKFMYQMVGRFYMQGPKFGDESRKSAPLNMLHTAITTLVPNLVFNNPKVKVRSNTVAFRPYGDMLELATNYLQSEIGLRMTLRKCITDAAFLAGFIKTGIAAANTQLNVGHESFPLGQPYADRIDPDDMILDPWARDWDEQQFVGNRFRADLDELLELGLYDNDELVKASRAYDDDADKRVSGLADQHSASDQRDVRRFIDLCEIWLPKENLIVTIPYNKSMAYDKFLRIADYDGPRKGPYHMLGFTYVSDNVLPCAPASIWYDLHILGNRIARKLARQAERMKRVLAYQSSAEEDAAAVADADDGETVRVEDVNAIKEVAYGGAGEDTYRYMDWVQKKFSEQAGSIDLLSGTGTNSPTATQAEMLQANTSVRLGDMQSLVYHFTAEVCRDLAYYLHTDPLIELPLIRRQGGVEQDVVYTPEMRQGDFFNYTFSVQPYSMARPDPNMQVRRKMEFATNVIPAAAQAAAMLGPGFDVGGFLSRIALDVGIEDADEFINTAQIQQHIQQQVQQSLMMGNPGKAGGAINIPQAQTAGPAMNPGQPNPGQMGPNGGISPDTEQAAAYQETAGELQANGQPSARAMAMAR
jgi:hypothetical protein